MRSAAARAGANIALIKYWGKRDLALNLPATGSLSITLSTFVTESSVTFDGALRADDLVLDGRPASADARDRVARFLDRVRARAGMCEFAHVESANNFPTASGLASSASGFAALALAASRAAGLDVGLPELASLARLGSGSAARSLLGGFVELPRGEAADGSDCVPRQVAPPEHWPVRLVVAVNGRCAKDVGSTAGMEMSRLTSPFFDAWVAANRRDLDAARVAVAARDFTTLGRLTEASCFRMHAVALACDPPLLYWNGTTVEAIRKVWRLREAGLQGYVTVDAGPHVKVLCLPHEADEIAAELAAVDGVERCLVERPGPGAQVIP